MVEAVRAAILHVIYLRSLPSFDCLYTSSGDTHDMFMANQA